MTKSWAVDVYKNKGGEEPDFRFFLKLELDKTNKRFPIPRILPFEKDVLNKFESLFLGLEDSIEICLRPSVENNFNEFSIGPLQLKSIIPPVTIKRIDRNLIPAIIFRLMEKRIVEISDAIDLSKL